MRARALILDVAHRARRIECDVAAGQRPLAAMQAAVASELGLSLGGPIGIRALEVAPEFLFVSSMAGDGEDWSPLATWAASDESGFSFYVESMLGGWRPPTRALTAFYFGDGPPLAAKLAHLVIKGHKRASTGWMDAAKIDGTSVPEVGSISIVTDGFGYAACAIRTTSIEVLRFRDVSEAHAFDEGEGDRTLADWREGHERFFRREAAALSLTFSEDAELFFEHFEVLAVFGAVARQERTAAAAASSSCSSDGAEG